MADIEASKPINATQLCVELGRVPLRVTGPYPDGHSRIRTDAVTDGELAAAVDAHVADPNYVDPENVAPEPVPTVEERLAALEGEVQAMKDRASVEAGKPVTTAQDVAAAVAGGA